MSKSGLRHWLLTATGLVECLCDRTELKERCMCCKKALPAMLQYVM